MVVTLLHAGIMAVLLWVALVIFVRGSQHLLAWTDDEPTNKYHALMKPLMKLFGYEPHYSDGYRHKNTGCYMSDSTGLFIAITIVVFIAPMIVVGAIKFYAVTIGIGLFAMILFLTRMVKRQNKLFNNHITNKDIHR